MSPDEAKIELYSLWKSTRPGHGTGIVFKIVPVPESRRSLYGNCDGNLYHFISDFGNTVVLTDQELHAHYEKFGIEPDPHGRYQRQMYLLQQSYGINYGDSNY